MARTNITGTGNVLLTILAAIVAIPVFLIALVIGAVKGNH